MPHASKASRQEKRKTVKAPVAQSAGATLPAPVKITRSDVLAGNLPFQPTNLSVLIALQRIKSPILETDSELSVIEVATVLWVMITPIDQLRQAMELESSPGVFPNVVRLVNEMCDGIDLGLIRPIAQLVNRKLVELFN